MDTGCVRISKESVVAYLKVLFPHSSAEEPQCV
jgi:hypothetical protein